MRTSRSRRMVCAAALSALLGAALVAPPASAVSSGRLQLIGPEGNFHCGDGSVTSGAPNGFGTVVIRQRRGEVSAIIRVRGGEPTATYFARLVQIAEDQSDCHFGEVAFRTDARGRATVRLAEPVDADTTGFNVSVNVDFVFGFPSHVAATTVPVR